MKRHGTYRGTTLWLASLLLLGAAVSPAMPTITDDINPMDLTVQVTLINPDPVSDRGIVVIRVNTVNGPQSRNVPYEIGAQDTTTVTGLFSATVVSVVSVHLQ